MGLRGGRHEDTEVAQIIALPSPSSRPRPGHIPHPTQVCVCMCVCQYPNACGVRRTCALTSRHAHVRGVHPSAAACREYGDLLELDRIYHEHHPVDPTDAAGDEAFLKDDRVDVLVGSLMEWTRTFPVTDALQDDFVGMLAERGVQG